MVESDSNSRRKFLKQAAWLLAAGSFGSLSGQCIAKAEDAKSGSHRNTGFSPDESTTTKYKIAEWTGDDFRIGHRFRNREFPKFPSASERTVDFVIVGGGMAGLASAHYLRDHNFLLLEQYDQLGGQSRGDIYEGIGYSYGAAYISNMTELVAELVADLKLPPVQLNADKNSWYWNQKWVRGVGNDKSNNLYGYFKQLILDFRPLWEMLDIHHPLVPLPNSELSRLDKLPLSSLIGTYDAEFRGLLDNYLKSYACASVDGLSALAGICILKNLVSSCYVLPGGNSAIVRAINERISNPSAARCRTSAFVWSIELRDNGASVVYSTKDGAIHKVNCRHVIVTVPPLVAARLLNNASSTIKTDLLRFRYGSYLVANLLLRKKILEGSYDNWFAEPFKFTNLIVAEAPYEMTGAYKTAMGSVLTIYQPYPPASEGRTVLLQGNRIELASAIVAQLSKIIDGLDREIDQVVLSRWGHAIAVAGPGYFAKVAKLNNTGSSAYSLAHCSTQGLASVESAIGAARLAADRALRIVPKRLQHVPGPTKNFNI